VLKANTVAVSNFPILNSNVTR